MENKEIIVQVCTGSTCYTQGRAILTELLKIAEEKYTGNVKVSSSPCLEVCSIDWEHSKAPYVKVNAEIVQEASVEKVLAEIDKQLSKE